MVPAGRRARKPIMELTAIRLHGIATETITAPVVVIILAMVAETGVLVTVEMVEDRVVTLVHRQLFQHLEWESVLKM